VHQGSNSVTRWRVPVLMLTGRLTRLSKNLTPRRAGPGFTMIEMLVVISLITLLIAMTLPSLGKSKERAVLTLDLSRIRQVMIASSTYALDNQSSYPYRTPGTYMPHQIKGTGFDFNKSLAETYVKGRFPELFCAGKRNSF